MKKYSINGIKEQISNLDPDYELLSEEYNTNKEKLQFLHKKCNRKFFMRVNDFKSGHRCPLCKNSYSTTEEYSKAIFEKTNGEYSVVGGDYKGDKGKLLFFHNICKKSFLYYPYLFRQRKTDICPFCFKRKTAKISGEDFIEKINKKFNCNNYEIIESSFKSLKENVKIRHKTCGCLFEINASSLARRFCKCPKCSIKSIGEEKILSYLLKNNISFKREYRIKECKDKMPLPFDFAVFKDEKISLIEYDGKQHFSFRKSSKIFNSKERLEKIMFHDKIKNDYCKKNNIKLLRISYKDFLNIDKILDNFFNNSSTTIL